MRLNVLSARVLTTSDGRSFDLFQVASREGDALIDSDAEALKLRLTRVSTEGGYTPVRSRLPRKLMHFRSDPLISFSKAQQGHGTLMELECNDRPGLLSRLAAAMADSGIQVHDARIATFGERVEDTFLISDHDHRMLSDEACEALAEKIEERLNN